jgi:hypothetical protein
MSSPKREYRYWNIFLLERARVHGSRPLIDEMCWRRPTTIPDSQSFCMYSVRVHVSQPLVDWHVHETWHLSAASIEKSRNKQQDGKRRGPASIDIFRHHRRTIIRAINSKAASSYFVHRSRVTTRAVDLGQREWAAFMNEEKCLINDEIIMICRDLCRGYSIMASLQ